MTILLAICLAVVVSGIMLPAQKLMPGTYLVGTQGWVNQRPSQRLITVQMVNPYTGAVTMLNVQGLLPGEFGSSFLINSNTSFFMGTKQATAGLPVQGNVYLVTLQTNGTWTATRFNTKGGLNTSGRLGINVSTMVWDSSWIYVCGSGVFSPSAMDAQVWRISRTGTMAGTVFVHSRFGAQFMTSGALGGSHVMVLSGTTLHVFTFDATQATVNTPPGINQQWSLSTNSNAPNPTQVGQNLPPTYRTSPPSGFASTGALVDPRSGNIIVVSGYGELLWRTPHGTNVNRVPRPGMLSTTNPYGEYWGSCAINLDTWELAFGDYNGSIDVYRDNGPLPTVNNLVKLKQPVAGIMTAAGLVYLPTSSVYHPIGGGCQESSLRGPWSYVNSPPTPGNQTFALTLSTTSKTAALAIGTKLATPFDFGPLGAPGCLAHVNPVLLFCVAPPATFPVPPVPVPANARGVTLYTQWMVLDPRANPLGIALSEARMLRP